MICLNSLYYMKHLSIKHNFLAVPLNGENITAKIRVPHNGDARRQHNGENIHSHNGESLQGFKYNIIFS